MSTLEGTATATADALVTRIAGSTGAVALVVATAAVAGAATAYRPVLGLAVAAAAVAAVFAVRRPALVALGAVWLAPIVPGFQRGVPIPHLRLSEILIVASAVLVLVPALARRQATWTGFEWLALGYVAATFVIGGLNMYVRGDSFTIDLTGKLLGPLQFLLLYRVVRVALCTPKLREKAIAGLLGASALMSVVALLQQFNVGPTRQVVISLTGSDIAAAPGTVGFTRATGLFVHYQDLGGYLFLIIMIGTALLVTPNQRALSRHTVVALVSLAVLALASTGTLVSILGAVLGVVIIGFWSRKARQVLLGLLIAGIVTGAVLAPAISHRLRQQFYAPEVGTTVNPHASLVPQSVAFRWDVWMHQYRPAVAKHILFGYGPGNPPEVNWQYTEDVYISLLLRGGIPLLVIYAFLMWALWRRAADARRSRNPEQRALGLAVCTVVLLATVMQLTNPFFVNAGLPHVLWVAAALLLPGGGSVPPPTLAIEPRGRHAKVPG